MQKTALTTIVGTPSEQVWSQAQTFVTGSGFSAGIVLCIKQETESDVIELAPIGAAMLETLRSSFEAVTTTQGLKDLAEEIAQGVGSGVEIALAIELIGRGELIMAGRGGMRAYLKRGDQLINLGGEAELAQGISGKLRAGDVLCLATAEMTQMLGEEMINEVLPQGIAAAESIAPVVHKQPDSSYAAAVIASYDEENRAVFETTGRNIAETMDKLKAVFRYPLRIRREDESPRRVNAWIAGGALIFLIVMIGLGFVRRTKIVAERDYQSISAQVNQSLSEAASIVDLNPERARILLSQSLQIAQSYSERVTKEPYNTNALDLVEKIKETEKSIFKVDTASLKTFIELEVLKSGLRSNRLYIDAAGNLLFTDTTQPQVIGMSIADKSSILMDTKAVGKVSSLGFFEKNYYGMTEGGVAVFGPGETEAKIVIESDPLWSTISQVESYAGNVYLLDTGNSEIWKYPVIKDGFGERRRWLGAGITLDLSKVVAMKVTGDIWIITSSGKLERYSRGAPVEFSMEGFPALSEAKRLVDPVAIYVTDDEVYVLERGAKRVVVFSQDGKYKAQYVNEEFGKASDLAVDKSRGYVMIDNVVKEFGL